MSSSAPDTEKVIGIIGGMGPEATVDLMRRIIDLTPARDDADHIRLLVDCNPKIPSRIHALIDKTGPSPAPCLIEMARGLEAQGADCLVIPCNTAHHYYADIDSSVDIPVLNMPALAAEFMRRNQVGLERVGVLASSALQIIRLYEPWFAAHGLQASYPDQQCQAALMDLICSIKAGRHSQAELLAFNKAAGHMASEGAQCLLIACTELSLIAQELTVGLPVYDASEILAEEVVAIARRH